jgi:outer membrane protein assembly factor BamA
LPCIALALLFAAPARAQIPAELVRRPVVSVEVTGETSGATDASDVGIPIGAPLTRRLLRSTVQRLLGSGRWADVQIDAEPRDDGVALVVDLVPRIVLTRVDVIGNTVLSDDEVRHAIGLPATGELENHDLAELANAVMDEYVQRGYVEARASLTLRDTDDPSRKVLRVRVIEGEPQRVIGYLYRGERPPPHVDLPNRIGLGGGAIVDRRQLREGLVSAAESLRRDGWLEARLGDAEIRTTPRGAILAIPTRFGPHYEVRLIGYEPLSRSAIEGVLQLEQERLTRSNIEALRTRVLDVLARHGFADAEVQIARFAGPREGTAVLEVQIQPGRQLNVIGISFPGATHFDSGYLRDQLISVLEESLPDTRLFSPVDSETLDRIGLGGRSVIPRDRSIRAPLEVDPARVYYEPLYAQAIEHLTEVYEAAGYLSARVGPASISTVGRGRAVVTIPVFEGPRTLLYGMTLHGNELIGDRELLVAAQLRRGEPLSYLALEEAIGRMSELYHERGYLYVHIEPDVRFSEDRERAEIALTIVERFEVRIGEIRIEGAERTSEDLIRNVLRFRSGDLYRPSVVHASQDALMALGIFSSVTITARDPDLPESVKRMIVTVREHMMGVFDGSLGVSTGQGVRGGAELEFRNIGGYAIDVSFRAQLGFQFLFQDDELEQNIEALPLVDRLERRVTITLAFPYIGIDNVRAQLDIVHLRDNERVFGLDKFIGGALSFDWHPERILSFTLAGEFEHNRVQLFGDRTSIESILDPPPGQPQPDPRVVRLLRVPLGDSLVVTARLSAAIDERDNPLVPTEGWFASTTVEWVRTLDTEMPEDAEPFFSHFLKLGLTANGYVSLDQVVLAGQFRIGGIVHLRDDSRTYPNRQYFLGGVDTLRGFNQDQLQPQDLADLQLENPALRTGTVLQGGDFFYLVRAEVRFPIFETLYGALFTDLGNHWADPSSIRLNENFVRPTAGFGFRVVTPVGPLAVDFGFNILRRELLNEPLFAFHFSIGVF